MPECFFLLFNILLVKEIPKYNHEAEKIFII